MMIPPHYFQLEQPGIQPNQATAAQKNALPQPVWEAINELKTVPSSLVTDNLSFIEALYPGDPAHFRGAEFIHTIGDHLREHGIQGNDGLTPRIMERRNKGTFWFYALMHWHYAGMPLHEASYEELQLTTTGDYGENRIYRAFIEQLKACNGAKEPEDYRNLMDWLIQLDPMTFFPDQEILKSIPGWQKCMRYELSHLAKPGDTKERQGFDGDPYGDRADCFYLRKHLARHIGLKYDLVKTLLAVAPKECLIPLLDSWFNSGNTQVREFLFKQTLYPLNTLFNERYPWNVLVTALARHLPSSGNSQLTEHFSKTGPIDLLDHDYIDKVPEPTMAFGRTFKLKPEAGRNYYLKVQSKTETVRDFAHNASTLNWLWKNRDVLKLESELVRPEKLLQFKETRLNEAIGHRSLSDEQREAIRKLYSTNDTLAPYAQGLLFSTSLPAQYEVYNYDVKDPSEAFHALAKYGRDYGRMWKHLLLGPVALTAAHDVDRPHIVISPFIHFFNEGIINRWSTIATDNTNVGGAFGMRDKGDTTSIADQLEFYRSIFRDSKEHFSDSDPVILAQVRSNELARAAQGLVLLYARRFNANFNHEEPKSVERIENDIGSLLSDVFSQAFPLSKERCQQLMEEVDLLAQCAREVSYWLAKDAPYVKDLRNGVINPHAYPHLVNKIEGCILTEEHQYWLRDTGFYHAVYSENDIKLGAPNGRNPLITLNAIIVKLLACGTLALLQQGQAEQKTAASAMASASCVA